MWIYVVPPSPPCLLNLTCDYSKAFWAIETSLLLNMFLLMFQHKNPWKMISGRVCMDIICWYRWTASTDGIQYREIQILTLEDNSRPSLDSTITMRRATASCEGFRFVKTSLFLDLNRCATCSSCSWNRNCETRISNYTQPELLQNSYSGKSRAAGRNGIQPQESPLFRPAPMCPPQIHRKFIRNWTCNLRSLYRATKGYIWARTACTVWTVCTSCTVCTACTVCVYCVYCVYCMYVRR